MKLMTEMQDGCVHALGYCVDTENVKPLEVTKLEHDAAAAHALKQVLDGAVGSILSQYARNLMVSRADELMRGWGFDPEAGK